MAGRRRGPAGWLPSGHSHERCRAGSATSVDKLDDDDTNMEMSDSATVRDNLVTVESARESLSEQMSSSSASVSGASSFISASSESASIEAEE